MILDGYNRSILLTDDKGVVSVLYRPAPRWERKAVRHLWKQLGEQAAAFAVYEWLGEHIVYSDIPGGSWEYPWQKIKHFDRDRPELFKKLLWAVQGLIPDASGQVWSAVEDEWKKNLADGIKLLRTNPKIAKRSCESCQKYWYREETGEVMLDSKGQFVLRVGSTMCQTQKGCPKGTPEKQKALNKNNKWALQNHLQCKATNSFQDDPIVKANAMIIERALTEEIRK